MIDERLIDALNDCIDRMAAGETIETCLSRYPEFAPDLRPMLEAGLLTQRLSYSLPEVDAARTRVRRRLGRLLGPPPFLTRWTVTLVLLSLIIGGGIGGTLVAVSRLMLAERPSAIVPVTVVTATMPPITATSTPVPQQPTMTTITRTPTVTPAQQQTLTQMPAPTLPPLPTGTGSPATETVRLSIEGPVDTINGNTITIFDEMLTLPASLPALAVLQVGDIIRVEAEHRNGEIIVATVTFISVEVISDAGRTWRDTGTCENPPPEWVQEMGNGTEWLLRCTGSSGGNGNATGDDDDGSSSDNDDDD